MTLHRLLYMVAVVVAVFSCNDDNPPSYHVEFPSRYVRTNSIEPKRFRVFARSGEIKDEYIIERYAGDTSYYKNTIRGRLYQFGIDTVVFTEERYVILSGFDRKLVCDLETRDNFMVATDTAIHRVCCSISEPITNTPQYAISAIKPHVAAEFVANSVFGYSFYYTGNEKFVFEEIDKRLTAPILLFSAPRWTVAQVCVNNLLEPEFYHHLPEGDTATVIEANLIYDPYH